MTKHSKHSKHSVHCPFCGSSNLRNVQNILRSCFNILCMGCNMLGPESRTARGAELKFRIRSGGEGTSYTLAGKEIKIRYPGFLAHDTDLVLEEGEPRERENGKEPR